jgi:hypothetical protein
VRELFSHACAKEPDGSIIPKWASQSIWALANYLDDVNKILSISIQGIAMVQDFPAFLEIVATKDPRANSDVSPDQMSMAEIHARAEFAKNEVIKEHPTLHAHALIADWGAMEAFVEDLCVALIVDKPEFLKNEVFSKVKVPLSEFELLDKEERFRFLIGQVEQQTAARRHGVDRFEALLAPFGLSGPVEEDVKKSLRACHHIRNVLVHRAGIADRRIVEGCPWLGLKLGDRVTVTRADHIQFHNHLWDYAKTVVTRLYLVLNLPTISAKTASAASAG